MKAPLPSPSPIAAWIAAASPMSRWSVPTAPHNITHTGNPSFVEIEVGKTTLGNPIVQKLRTYLSETSLHVVSVADMGDSGC